MGNEVAERTERATPKRRNKERDKGNIPKSQDMTSSIMATTGVALLFAFSGYIMSNLQELFRHTFTNLNPQTISTDDIFLIIMPFATATAHIVLPFLLILLVVAVIVVRMQIGYVFATDKIKPKFDNISPKKAFENAKKLFSPFEPRTLVELAKSVIKLVVVFLTGFSVLNSRREDLMGLMGMDVLTGFGVIGSILFKMLLNMCLAMLVIGFFDKKFQDYEYEKNIKMTKQDIKDEFKDTEGDPKIKSKVRAIQMQMMQQRMMSKIPTADVVVTNPTHYSIAIKYDKSKAPAPMVVAKGVDFIAFKIREVAQNNNIPIVENKPLAQALYKLVPIDGIIPSDMFVAVAEVLAYVYNKGKE